MTEREVDELRVLRSRAYGPGADIQSDPPALERLRQLEASGRSTVVGIGGAPEGDLSPITLPRAADEQPRSEQVDQPDPTMQEPRRMLFRPRRSTVLIVITVAMFTTVVMVLLTVVQRVQTDPLQVGASQIARLSVDTGFDPPDSLRRDRAADLIAFQSFYGVRAVVERARLTGATNECMTVYQPEFLEATEGGYSYAGSLFLTVCAAGTFPAVITITVPEDFPEALRNTYPVGTPLQFVYDRNNDEIVVFEG